MSTNNAKKVTDWDEEVTDVAPKKVDSWDEDVVDSPKQSAPSQGAGSGFQTSYTAPTAPTPNRMYGSTSPSASTSSVGGNKTTKAEQLLRKQYEAEGKEFISYRNMSFDEYKSSVKKWNDDIDLTNYDNLKKLFINNGNDPTLGNRYQEVVDFEKKLSTTSTSPSASTSSVGVGKIEVPKVVPNDIRAYEYSQSKLRDQDKKIQKLKGLHNDIDMGDAPNALVVQNQYNQELEKSQKERVALSQSALIAQTKVNASLNNIVSSIDKNKEWNKFIGTDNDGFENANIQAIDAYSRKVAKDSGAPETGYFQTLVKNKIKATAEYKIIEPDVNSQFEKLHKEKFGKTPSEYLGDDFAKAFKDGEKINKATNLELGAVQQELSTKAKEEVTPINDGYKTFAENLNVTYTQTQNDIQQKVAQLNDAYKSGKINQETYSSQFKGLEDNFKEVNDSYAKQIAESKKSYLDELNKINNKYNIQFKRQQSEIVRIANEQLKAEADKFTKAYKPNPKYVRETQELYSKAFENVSNASQKAKNIMDSYKGGGVRWVEGYVGTLGNSINGIATSLNMPNVALFGETLANEYKVGDSEIKSLKDLLDVNKMINSSSALAGGMTPSMLAAIPTGGASVALGAGALTAATISGLASWGVETMDMAGNTYNDILAQTGSVASAKEASDKVIQSQVVLMPTYAIEMLPFIHGGLSKVKSKLGKVAAGAAIDYGSEYMQEFPQNIFEKNIREGREYNDLKVLTQDYTDFTKLAEQAKSTALNLLPMIGMGAMGGLNQSDEKNEIAKKKINAIASSEILQQRFNKFNPYQFNQYIQGIYMAHGENFVQALAEASFANGTIDKEVYGKILDQKEKTKELVETSKSLGLSVSDSKLYNVLMSQFDEQMAKANNVEDVNAKAILIEKAKKYNQQAIDVLNLQEVPHVIVKYGNGIEMVWTQEQVENAMNDDAFIGNFINENIDIKLFNTESGFSNKLNEKVSDYEKREIESQEQIGKPIKYTSSTNDRYGYVEENGVKRDLTKQEFEDYGKVDMEQSMEAAPTEESKRVGEDTQAFTTDAKFKSEPIELSIEPSRVEEPTEVPTTEIKTDETEATKNKEASVPSKQAASGEDTSKGEQQKAEVVNENKEVINNKNNEADDIQPNGEVYVPPTTEADIAKEEVRIAGEETKNGIRSGNEKISDIEVRPDIFQFKAQDEESGVNLQEKLQGKYDKNLAGTIGVWKDTQGELGEKGKVYVVDGHHRMEFAKRNGEVDMNVFYIDAPTAKDARVIGAKANIAQGRGTSIDAAKVYKEATPEQLEGFKPTSRVAKEGAELAKLEDSIFNLVVQGKLEIPTAIAISKVPKEKQESFYKAIKRIQDSGAITMTPKGLMVMADKIVNGNVAVNKVQEMDLFGTTETEELLLAEQSQLESDIKDELAKDAKILGSANKNKEVLEKANNVLDLEANAKLAQSSKLASGLFDTYKNRSSVADIIKKATTDLQSAKGRKERIAIREKASADVKKAIEAELKNDFNGGKEKVNEPQSKSVSEQGQEPTKASQEEVTPQAGSVGGDVKVEEDSEKWYKAEKKVTDKDGNEITLTIDKNKDDKHFYIKAKDSSGKEVGSALFETSNGKVWSGNEIEVNKSNRRKGIMSAIYDFAESEGHPLEPTKSLSKEGKAFWENRKQSLKEPPQAAKTIEQLRADEQAELDTKIPNAEKYRVDGKVERSKLTNDADRKAFDDVYDKYDKLITPLLEKAQAKESKVEQQYQEAISKKSERAKNNAKEKFINDNFDKIVSQLMLENKIKRKC